MNGGKADRIRSGAGAGACMANDVCGKLRAFR